MFGLTQQTADTALIRPDFVHTLVNGCHGGAIRDRLPRGKTNRPATTPVNQVPMLRHFGLKLQVCLVAL